MKNIVKLRNLASKIDKTIAIRTQFKDTAEAELANRNLTSLKAGVKQRDNILPASALEKSNTSGVGFWQQSTITPFYQNEQMDVDIAQKYVNRERHVRVFVPEVNHMQCTPIRERGDKWAIQYERKAVYKTSNMGWTFSDDALSSNVASYELRFNSLEGALEYCRNNGLSYEISYPKRRFHTTKDYAANFKWKGNPKTAEELL